MVENPGWIETLDDWVWTAFGFATAWRHLLHLPQVTVYSGRVKGHRSATGDYLSSSFPSKTEPNMAEKVGYTSVGSKTRLIFDGPSVLSLIICVLIKRKASELEVVSSSGY